MKALTVWLRPLSCVSLAGCVLWSAMGSARGQEGGGAVGVKPAASEQEVTFQELRYRFVVPRSWSVQTEAGITLARSPDAKLLMVSVSLERPSEIPEAMEQIDKLVPVAGARFGAPQTTVQGLIPMQLMPGAGTLQPAGIPVELLAMTANIWKRPVVTVFFVHRDAVDAHMPAVHRVIKSFAALVTPAEAAALQQVGPPLPPSSAASSP